MRLSVKSTSSSYSTHHRVSRNEITAQRGALRLIAVRDAAWNDRVATLALRNRRLQIMQVLDVVKQKALLNPVIRHFAMNSLLHVLIHGNHQQIPTEGAQRRIQRCAEEVSQQIIELPATTVRRQLIVSPLSVTFLQ